MNLFGNVSNSQAETVVLLSSQPLENIEERIEHPNDHTTVVPETHSTPQKDATKLGAFQTFVAGATGCPFLDIDTPAASKDPPPTKRRKATGTDNPENLVAENKKTRKKAPTDGTAKPKAKARVKATPMKKKTPKKRVRKDTKQTIGTEKTTADGNQQTGVAPHPKQPEDLQNQAYQQVLQHTPGIELDDAVRRYSVRSEHHVMRRSEPTRLVLPDFDGQKDSPSVENPFSGSDSDWRSP